MGQLQLDRYLCLVSSPALSYLPSPPLPPSHSHPRLCCSGSCLQVSNPPTPGDVAKDVNHVNHLTYFPEKLSIYHLSSNQHQRELSRDVSQGLGIETRKPEGSRTSRTACGAAAAEFGKGEVLRVCFNGNSNIFGKRNILESFILK